MKSEQTVDSEPALFELFHENSKLSRLSWMAWEKTMPHLHHRLAEGLSFKGLPLTPLPKRFLPLNMSLGTTILSRTSVRKMHPKTVTPRQLATLLHYSYGVTRNYSVKGFRLPLRVVPSAGALYPLELFIYCRKVTGLSCGLYHYNALAHQLRLLCEGENTHKFSQYFVQDKLLRQASILVFITAVFERTTFKYGERGYRFVLLEAGHVAQNLNLVSFGLGLGCINIGGFFDRDVDAFLGLDGVAHSTLYILAVGAQRTHTFRGKQKLGRHKQ